MVKYIEPEELAAKIREEREKILIIDVRDNDYRIGRINGSFRAPHCHFEELARDLVSFSKGFNKIVFHCHYSMQRGPHAAQIFEDLRGESSGEVFILTGGFCRWKTLYRNEPDLFESL